ncbi:MAG: hypothetical protein K2X99_12875 [Gemmatimonadaceae bacterium]|nr:hypothetical protein [Gemmatimonadaceae bacterium]
MTLDPLAPTRPISLRVFGSPAILGVAEADAFLAQRKRVALLAYLAIARPDGWVRRDTMVGVFWPELDSTGARTQLRKAVHALRQLLGEDAILGRGDDELRLDTTRVAVDALDFDAALRDDRLAAALELHRADLLEGFFGETVEFEQWLELTRAHYRERAAHAAWTLAERFEGTADVTLAARWARKAARFVGVDERTVRKAMLLLQRAGDRSGAVQLYEEFRDRLRRELDVEPDAETQRLAASLRS